LGKNITTGNSRATVSQDDTDSCSYKKLPGNVGEIEMSVPRNLRRVMVLEDLDPLAHSFLPRLLWEFGSKGTEANLSREGNRRVFDEIWLRPRILKNVIGRTMEKALFGKSFDAPFGISPMGASAMFGFEADLNFARAARAANIPYVMSGSTLIPMEKIAEAYPDVWFQAYVSAERDAIGELADRVWRAGIRHLVVTVDTPVPGNRKASLRAGFEYPIRPGLRIALDGLTHPRWLVGTFFRTLLATGVPHIENYGKERGIPIISRSAKQRILIRDALDWDDMKWLREKWQGKLLIKGVLSPEDTRLAAKIGLDGLFVSNHGGRQLDTAMPPLKALPEIAAEKGNMAILFDGGIRRGTDVVKALALGADFVFAGRPFLYAAALGEEAGVTHAINLLKEEVYRTIALLGCNNLDDLASRIE
jgi:L-lactate dehydrogenase (cytochrome)